MSNLKDNCEYYFDKICPNWLNYLLLKHSLKHRKVIYGKKHAIELIESLERINQKKKYILVKLIEKIPENVKGSIE